MFVRYCGFIVKKTVPNETTSQNNLSVLFRAIDKRIPPIRIRTSQAKSLLGNRIVVTIDSWPTTSG